MNARAHRQAAPDAPAIRFTLDGREVQARSGELLIEVADREGQAAQSGEVSTGSGGRTG